jgi:hypothetical protein
MALLSTCDASSGYTAKDESGTLTEEEPPVSRDVKDVGLKVTEDEGNAFTSVRLDGSWYVAVTGEL